MDQETLAKLIDDQIPKTEQPFYLVTGYFLARYAVVEMEITSLLAFFVGAGDLETFHILTKGMDVRVKIERLRLVGKHRGKIGPNLKSRLEHIERVLAPLRNRIAHGMPWINEKETGKYHLVSLADLAAASSKGTLDDAPRPILARDLMEHAEWLRRFAIDLGDIPPDSISSGKIEIDHPSSPLPTARR